MSTDPKYIPPINSSGYFSLSPPFDTQVSTQERFTLKSVRTISDYLASNEDVKALVYTANGIDADYQNDLKNDIEILGIQSERGAWVYVPISYVICYPAVNGIPYRTVSIVLPLQPIPVDSDLTTLLSEISDSVTSILGFSVTAKVVETSRVFLITSEAAQNLEVTRAINKSESTLATVNNRLNNELQVAKNKIASLENYILAHP